MKKIKDYEKALYIAEQTMLNTFRILSTVFDANGGVLELDKKAFQNAEIKFHLETEHKDGKLIIKKCKGKSKEYKECFSDKGLS